MKFKRIFSVIVCLVLVCALVIGVSPIRAHAVFAYDDLLYLGYAIASVLGVAGVSFAGLDQMGYRALGQTFYDFMYDKAETDEQLNIVDVTFGVWYDVFSADGDASRNINNGSLNTWFNYWLMYFISDFVEGSKGLDISTISGPVCGSVIPAGQTPPGFSFFFNQDVYFVSWYNIVYYDTGEPYYYSLYSYCCSSVPFAKYDSSTGKFSSNASYDSNLGCYVTSISGPKTVPLSSENQDLINRAYNNTETKYGLTTLIGMFTDGTTLDVTESVSPTIVHSGLGGYFGDGGDPEDVVLPDLDLGNIEVEEGMTFPEALQSLLELLANGVITWEQYMEIVAPGQDIMTNNGQVITPEGVQSDLTLPNLLTGIKTLLSNLANTLLEGIKSIFVPSSDFITAKVDVLAENFSFGESVVDTVRFIGDSLNAFETRPPVIYVELEDSEGSINWGERVPILDLRWYERYKPTVDVLISAFMLLFFAWRVFIHLPNIFSGVAGDGNIEKSIPVFRGFASEQRRLPHSGFFTHRDP